MEVAAGDGCDLQTSRVSAAWVAARTLTFLVAPLGPGPAQVRVGCVRLRAWRLTLRASPWTAGWSGQYTYTLEPRPRCGCRCLHLCVTECEPAGWPLLDAVQLLWQSAGCAPPCSLHTHLVQTLSSQRHIVLHLHGAPALHTLLHCTCQVMSALQHPCNVWNQLMMTCTCTETGVRVLLLTWLRQSA